MKIFLHEITDQETELDFTQDDEWVRAAVYAVDERFENSLAKPKKRSIAVHFSLRKVDDVVVISGKIQTSIELLCSRCAKNFQFPCNCNFSALFCKDPAMAGVAHLQTKETYGNYGRDSKKDIGRPVGQSHGFARHAHNFEDDAEGSSGKDLDITYLSHDSIDLRDVLTEQLQLQVPFQPLCKEECKGICPRCGANLNQGNCACAKLVSKNPFSVLKDLKL